MLEDVKFAVKVGKELKVAEIGGELHVSLKGVFHFVFTKEEAAEVLAIINPQTEEKIELTEKETKVLKSIYNNTFEMGLPVEVAEIKEEVGFAKKTIVGVLGSLYKKGLVESYDLEFDDEFMISEKGYEIAEKL